MDLDDPDGTRLERLADHAGHGVEVGSGRRPHLDDRGSLLLRLGPPLAHRELEGEVVPGDQRGRELGFPTANIVPSNDLACPGHGVYAAFANEFPAAVNVGVRPTFETGRGLLVESYLIDQDLDLYGQPLRVAFVERLRGERRYSDAEELIEQMRLDVEDARTACAAFSSP